MCAENVEKLFHNHPTWSRTVVNTQASNRLPVNSADEPSREKLIYEDITKLNMGCPRPQRQQQQTFRISAVLTEPTSKCERVMSPRLLHHPSSLPYVEFSPSILPM